MFVMYLSIFAFFWVNKKYYLNNKHRSLLFNSSAWWEKAGYFISPIFASFFIVQSFRHLFYQYDILPLNLARISFFVFFIVESYQMGFAGFKPRKRESSTNQRALNKKKASHWDDVFSILGLSGFILGIISLLIAPYVPQKSFFEQISLICFSSLRIGFWGIIVKDAQRIKPHERAN
jgi:hypothetical protein